MPHIPDHTTHDPEPIAAYAAGDATGSELARATELVASCPECAALHHDLRAIAAAMPSLPAPVRSRDFRLTPEQAERLRPRGWRRLVEVLAGPRFAFAQPLGAGLATLGIAGLLLVAISGAPLAPGAGGAGSTAADASAASSNAVPEAAQTAGAPGAAGAAAPAPRVPGPLKTPDDQRNAVGVQASPAASGNFIANAPAPSEAAASRAPDLSGGAQQGDKYGQKETSAPGQAAASSAPSEALRVQDGGTAAGTLDSTSTPAPEPPYAGLAAGVIAAVGFGLVALRWVARRAS